MVMIKNELMFTNSWIGWALLVSTAYVIILQGNDGASLRGKLRKRGLTENSTKSFSQLKVDFQPHGSIYATNDNQTFVTILANRQNQFVAANLNSRIDSKIYNHGVAEGRTVLEGDKKNEVIVQTDSDLNDSNGAGDGIGDVEHFKNGVGNHLIQDILNANVKNRQDIKGKIMKKSISQDLKLGSNENNNRKTEKHQTEMVGLTKSVRLKRLMSSMIPLKIDELQPPDHVDGLRMEHDGHLNRDYKKEVLLGNHEEFEWESESKLVNRLKDIFIRVDTNHDDTVDLNELKSWIMLNVQHHLDEAAADNKRIFAHLDTDKDEFITWKEFFAHFMLAKGYDLDNVQRHLEEYDMLSFNPDEKERIVRYKFRWAEADEEPQDNRLTFNEFMNFRHPEQSKTMLVRMVRDLMDNFDKNGDKVITEEEFVMLPPGEIDSANMAGDKEWLLERRREFHEVIDLNKDDFVDVAELEVYVDPHNANLAKLEAENLIRLADQNSDGRLTLNEVLENAELFLGSKVVDASRNFHDEF